MHNLGEGRLDDWRALQAMALNRHVPVRQSSNLKDESPADFCSAVIT